uniref:Uncharacterized protein n=1 Tax=viral metagenome TaxID=1070528 RepID=A0A6C0C5J3_9ZZZZ
MFIIFKKIIHNNKLINYMKLILNKNNLSLNNIKFLHRYRYTKLIYDLNDIYMNGVFIRINEFKIYKNDDFIYILLLNDYDINLIKNIIEHINNSLDIKIQFKNNIIRMRNNYDINNDYIDLNINNIKKYDNKYILYVYNQ